MRGWWGSGWGRIGEGLHLARAFADEASWNSGQHSELGIDGVEKRRRMMKKRKKKRCAALKLVANKGAKPQLKQAHEVKSQLFAGVHLGEWLTRRRLGADGSRPGPEVLYRSVTPFPIHDPSIRSPKACVAVGEFAIILQAMLLRKASSTFSSADKPPSHT